MNVILMSLGSAIGGVLLKMVLGILSNPQFLEKAFILLAEKLVKHTSSDADDRLLELAKQALEHHEAKSEVK